MVDIQQKYLIKTITNAKISKTTFIKVK
jgi:hypothetical protein